MAFALAGNVGASPIPRETRPKQTAHARGDGGSERSHTPNHRTDDAYAADAKAVQQQPEGSWSNA